MRALLFFKITLRILNFLNIELFLFTSEAEDIVTFLLLHRDQGNREI